MRRVAAAVVSLAVLSLCGCPPSQSGHLLAPYQPRRPVFESAFRFRASSYDDAKPVLAAEVVEVGRSVRDRPIECRILGEGADVTFILATIHGNESAGTALLGSLERHLADRPHLLRTRRVVLMPVANPDGYAADTRHNIRGIDLNRNFPAANFDGNRRHGERPLCEPESRAIQKVLEAYKPARIVSIHQPIGCIDYDGPAHGLARAMANACDLPIKLVGSRPGSLGSYAGLTLGIPIITLELPRSADLLGPDGRWQRYGRALLAAVLYPEPLGREVDLSSR